MIFTDINQGYLSGSGQKPTGAEPLRALRPWSFNIKREPEVLGHRSPGALVLVVGLRHRALRPWSFIVADIGSRNRGIEVASRLS